MRQFHRRLLKESLKHEKEKEWEQLARSNPLFKELLDEYKDIRGRDKYLSDRFIEFIVTYSPSEEWENIVKVGMPLWIESGMILCKEANIPQRCKRRNRENS